MGRQLVNSYERESVEFQPVTITVDGTAVTTGVTFCLAPDGVRPVTFAAPATVAGKIGVLVTGLTPGAYRVWAKIASNPETPILNCGYITIT
jgi:hypothetical protein